LAHCVGGHAVDSEGGEGEERDDGKVERWRDGKIVNMNSMLVKLMDW